MPNELSRSAMVDPPSEPLAMQDSAIHAQNSDEAERRKLRRWFWALGLIAGLGLFGLLRYNYPVLRTPSGRTYEVTFAGRYHGTDGTWAELRYLSPSKSIDTTLTEVREVLPYAIDLAGRQGDSLVRIIAISRRFRFGLFTLDRSTILQFHLVGNEWRML